MSQIKLRGPSPALLVAIVALVAALGGTAVAEVATTSLNKKDKKQVKKIANKQGKKQAKKQVAKQFPVGSSQLADGAVTGPKIAAGAVDGAKIAAGSIGDEKLSDLDLFGDSFVRATPTASAGPLDAAQAAAPKVPLWNKGQLSAYGKCFTITTVPETYARVYVETSVAGAILSTTSAVAGVPDLDGDPDFLDPGTAESDRRLESVSGGAGSFRQKQLSRVSFVAMSPDGTAVDGLASVAVKSSGSNGVYGSGASCLFSGFGIG